MIARNVWLAIVQKLWAILLQDLLPTSLTPRVSSSLSFGRSMLMQLMLQKMLETSRRSSQARRLPIHCCKKTRSVKNSRKITFGGDVGASLPQWALDDEAALKPMEAEAKQHCLVQFNPLTEATYSSTVSRWSSAFVTLCNAVQRIRDN
mmetsp:Transcript_69720/g.109055  ORF Transcript_69720/g.109055 Transcript_69720/m.109055 type:complete len:149 (+) Transcript_69720:837-1283(+)